MSAPRNTLDLPDPYPNGTWVEITCGDLDDPPHLGEVGRVVEYTDELYQVHLIKGPVVYLPYRQVVAIPEDAVPDGPHKDKRV